MYVYTTPGVSVLYLRQSGATERSPVRLVVLGGGAMGRITVRALAEDERVSEVVVGDMNVAAAERAVAALGVGREKVSVVACDVRDIDATAHLLRGAGAVLNATDYTFNLEVMRAALAARVHYADLGGLFHMTRRQYALDEAFREAGIVAALGIGSTPGVTNLLARVAVDGLDRVERLDVRIGCGDARPASGHFVPPYSIRTIFDECTLPPMVYSDGAWSQAAPMSGAEEIEFPAPVGRAAAMYTLHSEVALFPVSFGERGLRHASFKIAFPPAFLSQLRLLVDLGLASTEPIVARGEARGATVRVAPREVMAALLAAQQSAAANGEASNDPSEPSDCDVLRVIAEGTRNGAPVRLVEEMIVAPYHPWGVGAGDIDTGTPLAIAGILLASGAAQVTGAHGAELIFEPLAFLRELARYGMRATETVTHTLAE
ncbi:MAG TPA: saccharopine dehydrogenase NADP-binding domain-containing protein [Ktedonobacterales bacterium]|jgi:saccharopine dehydrogenase-like NADP-dependent oxidoreductase|nr:saccharopine dehydrogenase NADP-binding domain-containing protein [Ktedonobacterales bacterium]